MRPPTRWTLAVGMLLATLAACGAAPGATSRPSTGTAQAPQTITPATSEVATSTTPPPVSGADTSRGPTTTSTPALEDPGDLYALDLASGEIRRLTTDPGLDGAPAWMPDGQRLLFGRLESGSDPTIGNPDIFLIAADGTAEQRLTDHPASDVTPRASPDGASVVFTSERDGNPELYLLVLATRELRRLTNHPASDRFPAFSPDGHTIVFTSDRAGDDDLYAMDLNGVDVRQLTDTVGTDWLAEFSPDGTTIAFSTDRSIDLIDADGSNRRTLAAGAGNHPSWAPDGRRIAAITVTEQGDLADLHHRRGDGSRHRDHRRRGRCVLSGVVTRGRPDRVRPRATQGLRPA